MFSVLSYVMLVLRQMIYDGKYFYNSNCADDYDMEYHQISTT